MIDLIVLRGLAPCIIKTPQPFFTAYFAEKAKVFSPLIEPPFLGISMNTYFGPFDTLKFKILVIMVLLLFYWLYFCA